MAKVVVVNNVTLDGVMQAPARQDEDTRGGFTHGGWGIPYGDLILQEKMGERRAQEDALLLGRRIYEDFSLFGSIGQTIPTQSVLIRASSMCHQDRPCDVFG